MYEATLTDASRQKKIRWYEHRPAVKIIHYSFMVKINVNNIDHLLIYWIVDSETGRQ